MENKTHKMKKLLLLAVVAFALQGCATLFNGTYQVVTFNSDPPDATVYVGKYKNKYDIKNIRKDLAVSIGKTPMTTSVKRNTELIFFSKEGYKDTIVYCDKPKYRLKYADPKTGLVTVHKYRSGKYFPKVSAWYFANLIFGGVLGMSVDLITGASINFDRAMSVQLEKK